MRTIAAVTVGRSDWGIYRPVLRAIQNDPRLELQLIVSGAHLTPSSQASLETISEDGFSIRHRVEMLLASDKPSAVATSMGLGTIGFANAFEQDRPDILLLLGDRFEMHTAAIAAVPLQIPIAHIHGGEVTHGAIDDVFRHAITKASHLHFPSTREFADRIRQLGEEDWRITVSGAPALDNLGDLEFLSKRELEDRLQLQLDRSPILVTYHPVTLQYEQTSAQIASLVSALSQTDRPVVITRPNVDSGHHEITHQLESFVERRDDAVFVEQLGTQGYFSLMKIAAAMVGNSSSGIIEAASFGLPVVNIGPRQAGRPRSQNIIDVECDATAIHSAITRVLSPEFRDKAGRGHNIYGDGSAAGTIVDRLATIPIDERLTFKRFSDLPNSARSQAAA